MPIAYGCIVQLHLLGEHTFKVNRGEQLFRIGQRQAHFTFFFNRYFCIRVIKFYQFASGEGKSSTRSGRPRYPRICSAVLGNLTSRFFMSVPLPTQYLGTLLDSPGCSNLLPTFSLPS